MNKIQRRIELCKLIKEINNWEWESRNNKHTVESFYKNYVNKIERVYGYKGKN
jgi:hypothetical protein